MREFDKEIERLKAERDKAIFMIVIGVVFVIIGILELHIFLPLLWI